MKYSWINIANDVEFDGPFKTAKRARNAAIDAAKSVEDTMTIIICKRVDSGKITRKFKWRKS